MAARAKKATKARPKARRAADLGPDTPISNEAPEVAESVSKPLVHEGSEGVDPNPNPTSEGYERASRRRCSTT